MQYLSKAIIFTHFKNCVYIFIERFYYAIKVNNQATKITVFLYVGYFDEFDIYREILSLSDNTQIKLAYMQPM